MVFWEIKLNFINIEILSCKDISRWKIVNFFFSIGSKLVLFYKCGNWSWEML